MCHPEVQKALELPSSSLLPFLYRCRNQGTETVTCCTSHQRLVVGGGRQSWVRSPLPSAITMAPTSRGLFRFSLSFSPGEVFRTALLVQY